MRLWKLRIKPGKPLAYGRIGRSAFFGLPGNPAAVFVTFSLVVRPWLPLGRGRADLGVWLERDQGALLEARLNRSVVQAVMAAAGTLKDEFGFPETLTAAQVLAFPETLRGYRPARSTATPNLRP